MKGKYGVSGFYAVFLFFFCIIYPKCDNIFFCALFALFFNAIVAVKFYHHCNVINSLEATTGMNRVLLTV